jgi:hypothetical protein
MQQNQPAQPALSENDIPQLLQLLQAALSTDRAVQKQAESMLASLELRVGFCSCLAVSYFETVLPCSLEFLCQHRVS